ncbi:hypothetical protein LEM8419_00988 [Neolewinella maritima]|uniref:Flavin reductase like domain-containing protein n=1 Tax=Neolewinella maritima TaxID=1383882 RepID=A0ABM9AZD5_9BACT|nr:flavin reductase family protein [Neolewinella maritima]CAH0999688.1 hypothetical protein LEM8419_00988 [Neolewinella maritima]
MILDPNDLSAGDLYGYLSTAVAPRPIAFVSTVDANGRVNLSPFSYFNVFSTRPPILVFSPIRRGRDGSAKDTLNNVHEVAEATISIVNYPMVEQVSLTSTEYPTGVNEFGKGGFTEVASEVVRPPRVGEAPVCFECRVNEVIALGEGGGAGNLVVCEVLRIHVQEGMLDDDGKLATRKLDLVARLGGSDYARITPETLFEIPKPLRNCGMGIDQLPAHIRQSTVLTGNNLGRLANQEQLPDADTINQVRDLPDVQRARRRGTVHLHELAQVYLREGRVVEALAMLV